ncbi:hypothetical protein B0J11DRAFT_131428 [Dendryphion nanum]|uniref:NAD(P)-binding protein n=1 Tax=Dendryphion nanum TaxID=256645 RepID=A0A9P9ICB1_9PLEO|nr:hypothetical protein B0J11DRAFT_131428 [Dendryphion nanum]
MTPKIFITGATGYIGGDTLHALYNKHPEYTYTALARTSAKGKTITDAFPNVRIAIGDLDNAQVLEKEAAEADIVIHTADASDNAPAARAIAKGLASTHTPQSPGYWLHTGGAGILCWEDMRPDARLGTHSSKQYNDWTDVAALTSLPDDAFHRDVDKLVLEKGADGSDKIRTAILCPPTIYGRGRGPSNARSRQAYELAKLVLEKEFVPVIGEGKARWNNVHVADLADVFVLLVERGVAKDNNEELWGEKGYYLVENGEHEWKALAQGMGRKAKELGFVKSELKEQQLEKDEAVEVAGFEAVSWGLNSRGKSERARRVLGWEPSRPSIEEEIEGILRDEKERLG